MLASVRTTDTPSALQAQGNTASSSSTQSEGGDARLLAIGLLLGLLFGAEQGNGATAMAGSASQGKGESDLLDQVLKSLGSAQQSSTAAPGKQVNSLLGNLSDTSLDQLQGGVNGWLEGLLKQLLDVLATLMDSQPQQFPADDAPQRAPATPPSASAVPNAAAAPQALTGKAKATPEASSTPSDKKTGKTDLDHIPGTTVKGNVITVHKPISVGPGETFDGQGKTFVAGPELGDGGQGEKQKPLFRLAEGSTLKNVDIDKNGADGIHVVAANSDPVTLKNVNAKDVGEDFLTIKGDGGADKTVLNVIGGSAAKASDKIFQVNAAASITIDGFKADNFGTFLRTNGGKDIPLELKLANVEAHNGRFNFIKSDSSDLSIRTQNVKLDNVKNPFNVPKGTTIEQA